MVVIRATASVQARWARIGIQGRWGERCSIRVSVFASGRGMYRLTGQGE
jgi:hypothetical protein